MRVELRVNGQAQRLEVSPWRRLLDVLREDLLLTGTKEGCSEGECGACTVLLDGVPINACLVVVAQAHGHVITTIEGLASEDGVLHDIQAALLEHGGTQCGICTPGIALTAAAALEQEPEADRPRLRELIAGNLCRCTGYHQIIDAMVAAAKRRRQRLSP